MFRNYLKMALRNLAKNRLTTGVNLLGLSLGMACVLLTFIFIRHELSFDRFHIDSSHIYRLTGWVKHFNLMNTPPSLAPSMQEFFPEVSATSRLTEEEIVVQRNNQYYRDQAHFVDSNFFSFFHFDLLEGSERTALDQPDGMVLTASAARKYFGNARPIGESMSIRLGDTVRSFTVRAIAIDPPSNSSIQFRLLLPLTALYGNQAEEGADGWSNYSLTTLVRLPGAGSATAVDEKMPAFVETYLDEEQEEKNAGPDRGFYLQAFTDYHLSGPNQANGLTAAANVQYLWIFALIAVLVLLVACLNFANLANAEGSGRLTEIGIRKLLGAGTRHLRWQFLLESVALSFIALLVAIVLVELTLPHITHLTGYELEVKYFEDHWLLPSLIGVALLTGILAGSYPALLLSRLQTIRIFSKDLRVGGDNWFTRGSMGLQFCLSIGLVACTIVMLQQQRFIQTRDLGFEEEQVIVIPTQTANASLEENERFVHRFRELATKQEGVRQVTATSYAFTHGNSAYFMESDTGANQIVFFYRIDEHYIPLLEMQLTGGRNFRNGNENDREHGVLVNEAFLKAFGIEDWSNFEWSEQLGPVPAPRILGVVKDFHFQPLRSAIQPVVFFQKAAHPFNHLLVKVAPEDIQGTLARLGHEWQQLAPAKPFQFHFLDVDIQKQYESEQRWSFITRWGGVLAVVIACLGLFGMLALTVARRTKEIGIRKVLGATYSNLLLLLSGQFALLILLAGVLAVPLSWYLMQKWLEQFAYRIELNGTVFIAATGAILLLAMLTIFLQSLRAARINPVEALRDE